MILSVHLYYQHHQKFLPASHGKRKCSTKSCFTKTFEMVRNLSYLNKNVNALIRREVHAQSMQLPNWQIPVSNATCDESLAQAHPVPISLCLAQDAPEGRRTFMDAKWPKPIMRDHKSKLVEGKENMKTRITSFIICCPRADSCNISYGKLIFSGRKPP